MNTIYPIRYGSSIAPFPISPHINTFSIGLMIWTFIFSNFFNYLKVIGLSYIRVFIAGATIIGFL